MVGKRKRAKEDVQTAAAKLRRLDVESLSETDLLALLLPHTGLYTGLGPGLSLLDRLRMAALQKLAVQQREERTRDQRKVQLAGLPSNPLVLQGIFRHLPPSDIKTAALVCRTWSSVVETPQFWTWATVTLDRSNFRQRFYSKRFRIVGGVKLEYYQDSFDFCEPKRRRVDKINQKHLKTFLTGVKKLNLTRLDADDSDFSCLPYRLVSQVVVNMEEVSLDAVEMGYDYTFKFALAIPLLTAIGRAKKLKLRKLVLGSRLDAVPEDILSSALIRLEELEMANVHLTYLQLGDFLQKIAQSGHKLRLRKLSIRGTFCLDWRTRVWRERDVWDPVTFVTPDSWAKAVIWVEEVHLPRLSPVHLQHVFREIAVCGDLKLKRLNIDEQVDLRETPAEDLTTAILRLEEINLMLTDMTAQQAESLCIKILHTEKFNLRTIKLGQTHPILALPYIIIQEVKRRVDLCVFSY